ncbi:Hypothetical protein NTJ_08081 [Nesidiocoris tenuis]|uniref:Uncharacterized protein n=1 Tax=Nesidiocoris tenuis TaxID=355587 RepID=A0ABN7AXR4_9HEMI|nr:Hypothetical protein NTJ_08081 [Nesidiocoris tenuis]
MRVAVTAAVAATALLLLVQDGMSSPLFFYPSAPSPEDKSHIQDVAAGKQMADEEEENVTQLLSEFSIIAVEFFIQIIGISVGAFNIIKDVVGGLIQGVNE